MTQSNSPDWAMIGGAVAAAVAGAYTVWARLRGASSSNEHGYNNIRLARDKDATANAARILKEVWRLVDQLQSAEQLWREREKALLEKIANYELKQGGNSAK